MAIRSIEIICLPCPKCEQLKAKIVETIKGIEVQKSIKINYEFKHTPNLASVSQYSVNPSQAPIVVINGVVEFTGSITFPLLKMKLETLNRE